MKAIVRAASFALVLAAGAASAQQAPRPDTVVREVEADNLAAILRAAGMTDVTARDQREEVPLVDFKARNGLEVASRLVNCQRGNHPTRCRAIAFQVCWTRAQFGRDLPDAAAVNTYNMTRLAGWAIFDSRGNEPRVCMRHAHVAAGATAGNIVQSAQAFVSFVEAFRRQFPAQAAAPAPAAPAATPAPATPAPAAPAPATPAPAPAQ